MCSRLDVDGLRGDLVVNRAAKALVALEGRDKVTQEDVGRVISSCLNHRCARACLPLSAHLCVCLSGAAVVVGAVKPEPALL